MQKILIIEDDGDIAAIERDYLELNNFQGRSPQTGSPDWSRAFMGPST